jgi:Domain of unknown function (DUF4214)
MLRAALDDGAILPAPGGATSRADGAVVSGALLPGFESPPPLPAALCEEHRDMAAPLDPGTLMGLQGAEFVRRVYLELLDREPDEGASFYTTALLEGRLSKLEILAGVRHSEEGKAAGREVLGLAPRFLVARACRLPVAGRLVRLATAVTGLPNTLRHVQRLE